MSSRQRAARKTTSPEWPQALLGHVVDHVEDPEGPWQTDRERSPATNVARLDQDSEHGSSQPSGGPAACAYTDDPLADGESILAKKPVDPIDPRWLSLLPPQDEQPAVAETLPLVGALLRLIRSPMAAARDPKYDQISFLTDH